MPIDGRLTWALYAPGPGPSSRGGQVIEIDLGDAVLSLNLRVRGLRPAPHLRWRVGPSSDTTPAERTPGPAPQYKSPPGKVDIYMDLKADHKVAFSLQATDEVGNPAQFDGTIVFNVDDTSIVTLTDNGDGSGEIVATGTLGTATLTATAADALGNTVATGVAAVQVVSGDAETFGIVFGEPVEATPDGDPAPAPDPDATPEA